MIDLKKTLLLPQTAFPMRGNLAQLEKEILQIWQKNKLYQTILASRAGLPQFVLHDGPPYANGLLHHGHILNKILKDIIIKDRTMSGFSAPFRAGWDCHGLPIENQVDKDLGGKKKELSTNDFNRLCADYAMRFVGLQKLTFARLGILSDWDNPYLTMAKSYEATVIRHIGAIADTGLLYRSLRPVNWCIRHQTVLAEAEVEYFDQKSPSVTAAFALVQHPLPVVGAVFVVIWTTTPWTLPANQAICVHPDYLYVTYAVGERKFVVAKDRLTDFLQILRTPFQEDAIVHTCKGVDLAGSLYQKPFNQELAPIICANHVTLDCGVGCVHTAPGHGLDDFWVGQKNDLPIVCVVDGDGKMTADTGIFAGLSLNEASQAILIKLAANQQLLSPLEQSIEHRYPHCWRCQQPIVVRATKQWFMAMDQAYGGGASLRQRALAALAEVQFVPSWGVERMRGMLANRPDWCLTRQRSWGLPLPVLYCNRCDQADISKQVSEAVAAHIEVSGWESWFDKNITQLIPNWQCRQCGYQQARREQDIVDVWLESGMSFAAVLAKEQANVYLEGSDQHRGWFHSSLLCAMALEKKIPFQTLITHGFVVDGAGKKISKSKGNFIDPQEIITQHGAELLRLWTASEDYTNDVRISKNLMTQLSEMYRKIRNCLRFFLGNLKDFKAEEKLNSPYQLPYLEQYVILTWGQKIAAIKHHFATYAFHLGLQEIVDSCVHLFSSFYFDIRKDCLYAASLTSQVRQAAQICLYICGHSLIRLIAPILCFTAEEAWGHFPSENLPSVHLAFYPLQPNDTVFLPVVQKLYPTQEKTTNLFSDILKIRKEVNRNLEQKRRQEILRSGTEAAVHLTLPQKMYQQLQVIDNAELADYLIVSTVSRAVVDKEEIGVDIEKADGQKCARCWLYRVETHAYHNSEVICTRCRDVLA